MNNSKVVILVGHIASGKSTYCKKLAKEGCLILNDDAIVNMLHADDYTLYDKKLKVLYKSLENSVITLGICLNKTILVDRGLNVTKQGRNRFIALANSFDVRCEALVFKAETPEIHATRRTNHDPRGHDYDYWLKVAQHHFSRYQVPTLSEGFDSVTEAEWQ